MLAIMTKPSWGLGKSGLDIRIDPWRTAWANDSILDPKRQSSFLFPFGNTSRTSKAIFIVYKKKVKRKKTEQLGIGFL
jgi:hypothetical protein